MAGRGGVVLPRLVLQKDPFGTELERRISEFRNKIEQATVVAAAVATRTSRQVFSSHEIRRPFVDPRPRRATTAGKFVDYIDWVPHRRDGEMVVDLDIARLEGATPTFYGGPGYWLIQEIGTGKSAYVGGHAPWERRVTVKSQMGRVIPFGLVWADANGTFQKAGSSFRDGNLVAAANATKFPNRESAGVIGREIEGKHFLRDGGLAGFGQFRSDALAVAKQAFAGRPRR